MKVIIPADNLYSNLILTIWVANIRPLVREVIYCVNKNADIENKERNGSTYLALQFTQPMDKIFPYKISSKF